jgi:hypothetical protein
MPRYLSIGLHLTIQEFQTENGRFPGRSAQLVFGWSFYRQGSSGQSSSADGFLDAALTWFGDPDSHIGTAWEKGERLARLVARPRTLLILDRLEPLQNPLGPQEGRLREPSLQALLRELAAFNMGLCVITTRLPVADRQDVDSDYLFASLQRPAFRSAPPAISFAALRRVARTP